MSTSATEASPQATVDRTTVGVVKVGPDSVIVTTVARTYDTAGAANRNRVHTAAPVGVDVRRDPTMSGDIGALSPRAARELAGLLVIAAEQADRGAAPQRRRQLG